MKILLIGRFGQVAWELQNALMCLGDVIAVDRSSLPYALDLANTDSIVHTVAEIQPDLIVNAAAYTAVDKAEQDIDTAMQVNGSAMAVLAEAAKKYGAILVHYSTDYVFDGAANVPYIETQAPAPQGVYGESKLLGEQAIINSGVDYLILRTAWVYGNRGQNFLLTMLRLMQSRESLGVVDDQIGSPTWSRQIALATALMLAQCLNNKGIFLGGRQGVYHLTCAGATSWYDFAKAIQEEALRKGILQKAIVLNPIDTAAYPTLAKRPAYSVLSGAKLQAHFHLQLPPWQRALICCLNAYPSPI